ncbi:MAG: hypothetical protein M3O68_00255 [Thermoproteota archaeon]|nr:hypothetical protein [Thermoproteota archaeon]
MGSYVGRKIVTRIDQDKFRDKVLIAIVLASIKFILDGNAVSLYPDKFLIEFSSNITVNFWFRLISLQPNRR